MLNTIWWNRNTIIFQGEKWTVEVVIKKACNMTHSYKDNLMRFESLAKFGHCLVIENGRMLACGGVVCDHTGFFIFGFISNLGGSSILVVELKYISLGL